jgi:poly-gamma-glutamate capsule biosynthesis protein CapA/YwtB (metallophosphatase superfamily)
VKLALLGDTMLGRRVAAALRERPPEALFAPEVVAAVREADLVVANLECCISERGEPADKIFTFRAPPAATAALAHLGVDCVTLANNHAVDYGRDALLDTFEHLDAAGIAWVGAGENVERARRPVVLEAGGIRLGVIGVCDHQRDFAAAPDRPGIAYAELPGWIPDAVRAVDADAVLVSPHWGPNMVAEPEPRIRSAARALLEAGATLVAGHSAHVFHGVEGPVLYDLGDFVDDYAVDPKLRNDLGLLFLVELDERARPARLEAVPLELEFCHTRLAAGDEAEWVRRRFHRACGTLGTEVREEDGRLLVSLASSAQAR